MTDAIASAYDGVADAYASRLAKELDSKPFDRAFLDRFAAALPAGPVLDIGCGPGHVGRYVRDRGRAVSGVDFSEGMIARARALHPGMAFEVGDMRSLDVPDASLAGLIAFYAIVHLPPDALTQAFTEMRRVLQPGGLLSLAFHVGNEVRHVDALWGIRTSLDFVFFEPDKVAASLAEAGFGVRERSNRAPYDAAVEAQTDRCYILAARL